MKKIFWIDLASRGDASFYSNSWNSVLGSNAKYFVHKSVSYAHHFFRYGSFENKSFLSNYLIFFEHSLLLTLLSLTISRKKFLVIINIYQPFKYYEIFLRILNFRKCESIIILHDVKEFSTNKYPNIILSSNRRIIKFSDNVILHNHLNLFHDLLYPLKRLISIPFPVRNPYPKNIYHPKFKYLNKNYILFIGSFREEKGLDQLLNLNKEDLGEFLLLIASCIPSSMEQSFIEKLGSKVLILNKTISDLDFEFLVSNASYGVCPYKMGSNSGIYSTFLSNMIPTITSNTSVFESFYVIPDLQVSESNDYSKIFSNLPASNSLVYLNYQKDLASFIAQRHYDFSLEINSKIL